MKRIACLILFVTSTALAKAKESPAPTQLPPAPAAPSATENLPQELKVGVKGMVCAFCAQGIEKKFKSQPEVSSVEVSLENKYVKLKFKPGQTLGKDKVSEILKDAGYEAIYGE